MWISWVIVVDMKMYKCRQQRVENKMCVFLPQSTIRRYPLSPSLSLTRTLSLSLRCYFIRHSWIFVRQQNKWFRTFDCVWLFRPHTNASSNGFFFSPSLNSWCVRLASVRIWYSYRFLSFLVCTRNGLCVRKDKTKWNEERKKIIQMMLKWTLAERKSKRKSNESKKKRRINPKKTWKETTKQHTKKKKKKKNK